MKMTSASYEIANRTLKLSRTVTGVQVEVLTLGAASYRNHFSSAEIKRDEHHEEVWSLAKAIFGSKPTNPIFPNCPNSVINKISKAIEQFA